MCENEIMQSVAVVSFFKFVDKECKNIKRKPFWAGGIFWEFIMESLTALVIRIPWLLGLIYLSRE